MSAGPVAEPSPRRNEKATSNIRVGIPRVHLTGSHAHDNAYLEVGRLGFALFLGPEAAAPMLDIDGTLEQLDAVVHDLQAALAARRMAEARTGQKRWRADGAAWFGTRARARMKHARHQHSMTRELAPSKLPRPFEVPATPSDRLLLCSDALTEMVANEAIAAILEAEPAPEAAAKPLLTLANEGTASENITLIVIRFDAADSST